MIRSSHPLCNMEVTLLKALYYPHTDIGNEVIVKNALLLWDQVETIIPSAMWRPEMGSHNRNRPAPPRWFSEAAEIVVARRVPDTAEQQSAHETLSRMVSDGVLHSLIGKGPVPWRSQEYLIYPEKFLDRTWDLLRHAGIANWVREESDYGVPAAVGLLMMSVLADVCAGSQLQKITDLTQAYSWLAQQRASLLGSQYVTNLDVSQIAPDQDRLAMISPEVLDARKIPIKKLIALRRREAKDSGSDLRAMRRRFAKAIHDHVERIGKEARTGNDVKELSRQFRDELKTDLHDLKKELQLTSLKTLFSKEVGVSVLLVGGSLVSPVAGLTGLATNIGGLGVIPLLKAEVEHRAARREILRKHTMSWLYLAAKGPISML